jgi:biotin transport system substrate-specific component
MNTYILKRKSVLLYQIAFGIIGLAAASQINIPIHPVPINLGTVAVMLIGLNYSFHGAIGAVFSYITLGICGLPIFSHFSGGFTYFFGPTFGYLIGYFVAASLMSFMRERYITKDRIIDMLFLCLMGQFCIFTLGVSWLSYLQNFEFAIKFGLLPFILPGIIKSMILAASIKVIR